MRLLTLLLVPAALFGAPARFARLGDFEGPVEVQLTAADPWIPAQRNLPLTESAWLRTGAGARVEIELDEGGAWRLGADSLGEISDYTQLSTGQRITLLSLDHGTAYYTGQPAAKDVTMVVMPGAQATILQGSRIRQTAQPGASQLAVLEGQVRFSSPAAELDVHEGGTAQVDPSNPASFALEPSIAAAPLDKWSEERDRAEDAPVSTAYVTAQYGLGDLDSAGEWLANPDLGMVWKPKVAEGWMPYQNGRWRYYDAIGYTWVSDDSWGWLPYHNGRWTKLADAGWVWQPALTTVFHPGEVYWMRGADFAGWGPLAPGEQWTGAAAPLAAASTSYAGFQPDARTVDGAGFAAPSAQQLQTAIYVAALPSPPLASARLDAVRPMLQVGSTRVVPWVQGVTFGDAPPEVTPETVPDTAAPPSTGTGATPPPDGIYGPPPVVDVANLNVSVITNPPAHPDYAKPASGTAKSGSSPGQSTSPSTGGTANAGKPNGPTTGGNPPVEKKPAPAPKPAPRPVVPPAAIPRTDTTRNFVAPSASEEQLHQQVLKDIEPSAPDFARALKDLDAWTRSYPKTASSNDRLYYYIHVYRATGHADQVLEKSAPLVDAGVRASFADREQVLQVLVAASDSAKTLAAPNARQLATGQKAARELLDFLPVYFAPARKPAKISARDWNQMRAQLEAGARATLARQGKRTAAN